MNPSPEQIAEYLIKQYNATGDYRFEDAATLIDNQSTQITQLQAKVEALRKDAERYQKHCRNAQVAAWCGLDPYTPDVLKRLDVYIDAAIIKVNR